MIQQSKTLSASQVQNNFGALVKQVRDGEYKEIIVENRGEPVAAIIGMEELQIIREYQDREKQKKALDLLRESRAEVQARLTSKLTDGQAIKCADSLSDEMIEDLAQEGKVKFERKST